MTSVAASLLAVACSDDGTPHDVDPSRDAGVDAPIFPQGLLVNARAGGSGVFALSALTLQQGASGGELYVALRNEGDVPACSPALSVELLDAHEQSLGAGVGGLLVRHFYRLTDGSGTMAACVAPGDVTMIAITDLPADLVIEDVSQIVYSVNYWNLSLTPIGELSVTGVRTISRSGKVAYSGELVNGLDVALTTPAVAIFPINRVGRPLGVARDDGSVGVPPGGSWPFETNSISQSGAAYAAYPASGP